MQSGLPTSEALTTRQVGAFALDTSILQAASFRFEEGQLKQLSGQLPPWLKLWMPEIVAKEVFQHRMEALNRAVKQVGAGFSDIERYLAGRLSVSATQANNYLDLGSAIFDEQLLNFIRAHSGELITLHGSSIAQELFDSYFEQRAPFGGGRDKKHEFPDAAILLSLEEKARKQGIQMIVVSMDIGWKQFADTSKSIYCVEAIPELTRLFEAKTQGILKFKASVGGYLQSHEFNVDLRGLLSSKLIALPWLFRTPPLTRFDVDARLSHLHLRDFAVQVDSLRLWTTSPDQTACVTEVIVDVEVDLEIDLTAHAYKQKFSIEIDNLRTTVIREHVFEVTIAVEFGGGLEHVNPASVVQALHLLENTVRVDLGRVKFPSIEFNAMDFEEFEDDIPF
jgi:hypothetical protein